MTEIAAVTVPHTNEMPSEVWETAHKITAVAAATDLTVFKGCRTQNCRYGQDHEFSPHIHWFWV